MRLFFKIIMAPLVVTLHALLSVLTLVGSLVPGWGLGAAIGAAFGASTMFVLQHVVDTERILGWRARLALDWAGDKAGFQDTCPGGSDFYRVPPDPSLQPPDHAWIAYVLRAVIDAVTPYFWAALTSSIQFLAPIALIAFGVYQAWHSFWYFVDLLAAEWSTPKASPSRKPPLAAMFIVIIIRLVRFAWEALNADSARLGPALRAGLVHAADVSQSIASKAKTLKEGLKALPRRLLVGKADEDIARLNALVEALRAEMVTSRRDADNIPGASEVQAASSGPEQETETEDPEPSPAAEKYETYLKPVSDHKLFRMIADLRADVGAMRQQQRVDGDAQERRGGGSAVVTDYSSLRSELEELKKVQAATLARLGPTGDTQGDKQVVTGVVTQNAEPKEEVTIADLLKEIEALKKRQETPRQENPSVKQPTPPPRAPPNRLYLPAAQWNALPREAKEALKGVRGF